LLTLLWICFEGLNYYQLSGRPAETFVPGNYFGKALMPQFPDKVLFYSVMTLGLSIAISLGRFYDNPIMRGILFIVVAWLNLFQWSFGFESSVGHLLILTHFLAIFLPSLSSRSTQNKQTVYNSICVFYLGILITYSFSGLWKVIGLAYKLITVSTDIHWLNKGALYMAVISARNYDKDVSWMGPIFAIPLIWQILFLIVTYTQSIAFVSAFRLNIRIWIAGILILMHLANTLFFSTDFFNAPLVLLSIFFPYHLVSQNNITHTFTSKVQGFGKDFSYTKIYEKGDIDSFKGFYGYRESWVDKHSLLGGLLFAPGVGVIGNLLFNLLGAKKGIGNPIKQ
jgi:hypothetical protein